MKKRVLFTLLAVVLCFTLTACAVQNNPSADNPSSSSAQNTSSVQTDAIITPSSSTPEATQSKTTVDQAKAIALQHAGIAEKDAKFLRAEYDYDDGVASYEIEFNANGSEYEYDVKASNGDIIKAEKNDKNILVSSTSATLKTNEEVKTIAFSHAKVTEDKIYGLEIELDTDDVVKHYEIEFKSGGYEYKYDINAESGEILKSEKDFDD